MKYIIVVNIIYLYYIIISSVVRFEVKVVFVIKMFFFISFCCCGKWGVHMVYTCTQSNLYA